MRLHRLHLYTFVKAVWLFAGLLCLFVGGRDESHTQAVLARADNLIKNDSPAVFALPDSMAPFVDGVSRAVCMEYALLYADARYKCFVPFRSDCLMLAVADYFDSHGSTRQQLWPRFLMGCIYKDLNEVPIAIRQYFQSAVKEGNLCLVNHRIDLVERFFHKEWQMSVDYNSKQAAAQMLDSIYATKATEQVQQLHSSYNYNRCREESDARKLEISWLNSVIITVSILVLILVLGIYFVMRCKNQRLMETNRNYSMNQLLQNKEKELVILRQQRLHDKEVINQQKSEIESLQSFLSESQKDRQSPHERNISGQLMNAAIVFRFHDLAAKGKRASPDDWQMLILLFQQSDRWFWEFLKASSHTPLKERELYVCLLLRLRFIPSELSCLLNISSQVVTNMRSRLFLKLFGTLGGAKEFDERIRYFF